MSELSPKEQLYINVGKCLSVWNQVEAEILHLTEYGCASNDTMRLGYWAINSFEARLKMCNAVVTRRLAAAKHDDLAEKWNALNNKLIKKSQKRAEIAHGRCYYIYA
jgi:hypothetical protein